MTPKWYVPRRTLLQGLGAGVALPFLEAMVGGKPRTAQAALDPRANPRRFVGIWGLPNGQVAKWDKVQNTWVAPWTPQQEGPLTKVDEKGFLAPFFDSQDRGANGEMLHEKLSVLTGLSD